MSLNIDVIVFSQKQIVCVRARAIFFVKRNEQYHAKKKKKEKRAVQGRM